MTEPVEQGEDFTKTSTIVENDYLIYNLYTKTATIDKLSFTLNDENNGYIVKKASDQISGDVTIPRLYNDVEVLGIESKGFWGCYYIENIYINGLISIIPEYAFFYNIALKHVNITNNITILGGDAFSNCRAITSCRNSS